MFSLITYSFVYRSQNCECIGNTTTLANATRNNGNNVNSGATTTMIMTAMGTTAAGASVTSTTTTAAGCPCATGNNGGANAFAGAHNVDSLANNAENVLSSNIKFQAISAIAVSQDGVINIADQGNILFFVVVIIFSHFLTYSIFFIIILFFVLILNVN